MRVPEEAEEVRIAFLPPMSGLMANETRLDPGAINVRVGEGRTAEVLRNLCYRTYEEKRKDWDKVLHYIRTLFGAELVITLRSTCEQYTRTPPPAPPRCGEGS